MCARSVPRAAGVIVPLVESARGIARARRDRGRAGGEAAGLRLDRLPADVGIAGEGDELLAFRSALVLASRLAELAPPVDGVTPAIDDAELCAPKRCARAAGLRRQAVHPSEAGRGCARSLCADGSRACVGSACDRGGRARRRRGLGGGRPDGRSAGDLAWRGRFWKPSSDASLPDLRRKQSRGRAASALRCGGRRCAPTPLRCSGRGRAAELTAFAALAAFKQLRRVSSRSALRAPTPALRSSPPQRRAAAPPAHGFAGHAGSLGRGTARCGHRARIAPRRARRCARGESQARCLRLAFSPQRTGGACKDAGGRRAQRLCGDEQRRASRAARAARFVN